MFIKLDCRNCKHFELFLCVVYVSLGKKKPLFSSELFPPWFHLLAPRRPRLPSRWRRRWPLATTPQLPRSRTCPMVQLQEIPLPRLPLRQLPPSRLPPHQEQTYLNKSPTFDKQKLEFAKNWAYADLPRISQVFLPNWQQDLRLLNLIKLSFFWDTLYISNILSGGFCSSIKIVA